MSTDRDFARLEAGEGVTTPAPTPRRPGTVERARTLIATAKPLLTLETVAPLRPTIRIDGFDYRLPLYEDFSLWQHQRMQQLGERARELQDLALAPDAEEVTIEQWSELDRVSLEIYGTMVEVILPDLPAPTRRALTLPQREAIVREFFTANQARSAAWQGTAGATPPTGGPSSAPSSPASATTSGGRGKRRSANSARPTGA